MDEVVTKVKEANPLEDVMEGDGFGFKRKVGRYLTCQEHDSLVVDTVKQLFVWNSRLGEGWAGDVITWMEKQHGMDFRRAVELLAERAKIKLSWGHVDEGALRLARAREEAFETAMRLFQRWLWEDAGGDHPAGGEHPSALGYARGRGWSDETIREAGLGFTGGQERLKEMRGEMGMFGIDVESPAAVAVVGYRGDVRAWGRKWGVEVEDEAWVEWGMIPGAMSRPRLVYPHLWGGRARYFTTREITPPPGPANGAGHAPLHPSTDGEGGKRKSWNPPRKLAGERQVFFNHAWRRGASEVVIVEGPADAISLGQWGMASVALCGLGGNEEALGRLRRALDQGGGMAVYVAMDADEEGGAAGLRLARWFGPMTRVVEWGKVRVEG